MSYNSLNSLRGVIWAFIWGTTIGLIKGDTRSLDYGSNRFLAGCSGPNLHPNPIAKP